jgi:tetratricopeptide (TPR) repeat protein
LRALTGQYAGAVADLTESMRSRCSFISLSTRAYSYSSMNDYHSAIKDFDEALTLSDKRTGISCLIQGVEALLD